MRLLVAGDPDPVVVDNPSGSSDLLLVGDHAGRRVPRRLRRLELQPSDVQRHIAWDIGVRELGAKLAKLVDGVFIHQAYSRLVIDCNRTVGAEGSIVAASDGTEIAGNADVNGAQRRAREKEIFLPYHAAIAAELDRRGRRRTIVVSLHSFTPVLAGQGRRWRYGVLHRNDSRFSTAVLRALSEQFGDEVGDNEPYAMDGTDFTIPHHADRRGLDYLELEVRQDQIQKPAGQDRVAAILAPILTNCLAACGLAWSRSGQRP